MRDDPDRTKVAVLDPLVGKVIAARYRIELDIASGGFGKIYRALDLESGRDVALKLLHQKLTSDPAVIARFRREAATLSRLRDPHTVTGYDFGETKDGTLYIAMELLQGQSLYQTFKELGALPWRRVVTIARAVCSSLAEAHALGIVHRDLKPANIHLEERGDERDYVKVLDFGIAKIVLGNTDIDNSDLTHAGTMIGTFDYMPPEQMVGGECTGQSDVFTLGIVMYEMIVGERPFGDLPTAASMLAALLSKSPEPPSARVEAPPELDRIVLRCLDRNPLARFTVTELAGELDRLLGNDDNTRFHLTPAPQRITTSEMDAQGDSIVAQPPPISDDVNVTDKHERVVLDGDSLDGATKIAPPPVDVADAPEEERTMIDTQPRKKFITVQTLPGVAAPKKKP